MRFSILILLAVIFAFATEAFSQTSAKDHFNRGANKAMTGKFDEAIVELTKAIELNYADLGQAYLMRGNARYGKKDYAGAWDDATRAIPLLKDTAAGFRLRGETAYARSDIKTALTEFTKAIDLNPTDYAAHLGRATARDKSGDADGAIADYTKAIGLNAYLPYEPLLQRGFLYHAKGDTYRAFADFDKAVAIAPRHFDVYHARGWAHLQNKGYDAAIADLKKALAINPQHPEANHLIGHAYDRSGRSTEALAAFTAAIKAVPGHAEYYHDRGLVYRDQLLFEKAVDDISKALALEPKTTRYLYSNAWMSLLMTNHLGAVDYAEKILAADGMKEAGPDAVVIGYLALRTEEMPDEARAFLRKWIGLAKAGTWEDKLLKFLNGQLTPAQLLAAAGPDEQKQTYARSVIGTLATLDPKQGRKVAKIHLDWVITEGKKGSFEYLLGHVTHNRYNLTAL